MRILLDNNVPVELKRSLSKPHNVLHCRDLGWQSLTNGKLVLSANDSFEVMVTLDKNMPSQTPLKGLALAVLVIDAMSNAPEEVLSFAQAIRNALSSATPGEYFWIRK